MRKKFVSLNFLNYVLIHLSVVLSIIAIMGGYLYSLFYKTVYSDFLLVNEQHISAVESRHENDIRIIDDIVTQMSLTPEATRFMLEKRPDKAIKLEEYLKRYTTVSQFFNLILYQYHHDHYLYSYSSSIDTDVFFDRDCVLEETTPEVFRSIAMEKGIQLRALPEQTFTGRFLENYFGSERRATFFIRTIPSHMDETLLFIVPGTYYDKLLVSESAEKRDNFLFFNEQLIVCRGTEENTEESLKLMLVEKSMEERLKKGTLIQEKVQIENGNFLLSVKKGESGIYYGTMQNMDVFYDKLRADQMVVVLLILVCAVVATFVSGFFSSRMMRKIKSLSKVIDEEGSYDLGYIERGIQTLVVTQKASEKESLDFRKARFIRNFFRGYLDCRETMLEEAKKVGLNIDYRKYVVVLIRSKEIDNEDKVYSLMLQMIAKEKDAEGYGIHLVNNNQNLFVLFADTEEKIEQILVQMLAIESEYCQDYVISVSDYHTKFEESSKAYIEADTAFDYRLLMNNSEIIRFVDVVQEDYTSIPLEKYLQGLKYAISTGNKEAVETAAEDICQKIKGENVSLYAFRMLYNNILQVLVSECRGDKLLLDKFYNAFTLSQCMNIKEFYDLLSEAGKMIIDSHSDKVPENSDIVREAIAYMQQNYQSTDFNMNALAEYLNISSVTLSIEFKNEMEVKPSEYLANLRIEKSKDYLRNTDMLIKEISIAVGYEDDGSFTRRFKKHAGMTPGQYREAYR